MSTASTVPLLRMRIATILAVPLLLTVAAVDPIAQSSTSASSAAPTFDAVSIKRNTSGFPKGANVAQVRPDGGFTFIYIPMSVLVSRAYQEPGGIEGLPDWATRDPYDVMATSTLTRATPEETAAMLRAMLVDRLKLAVHIEPRPHDVYKIALAHANGKLGSGLTPSNTDCEALLAAQRAAAAGNPAPPKMTPTGPMPPCALRMNTDRNGQTRLEGEGTIARFTTLLRVATRRTVVDDTGLAGNYHLVLDFDMRTSRGGPDVTPAADAGPSIFTAIQEQLGLKLVPARIDQDTLVIDHIERPSEN